MESTRAMTRERGSRAESKNCEILLFPTADRRFDRKVKCPTGRASFWVKFPTVRSLTRIKCPGIARGRGGFGIHWYINIHEIRSHEHTNLVCWIINLLLNVLLCSIAENFYSFFVFRLALRARQYTAQLVKLLSDTTQQNV